MTIPPSVLPDKTLFYILDSNRQRIFVTVRIELPRYRNNGITNLCGSAQPHGPDHTLVKSLLRNAGLPGNEATFPVRLNQNPDGLCAPYLPSWTRG